MTTGNLTVADQLDVMIAMLDITAAALAALTHIPHVLQSELLIDTNERDRLQAEAQTWADARQAEVFAL